jgi:uncharacterized C2H2 Zn-finger protein
MSIHQCIKCNKEFKQKIDYSRHINRKRPCIEENNNILINNGLIIDEKGISSKIPPKYSEILQNSSKIPPISSNVLEKSSTMLHMDEYDNKNIVNNYKKCNYCHKEFTRVDNLIRHINQNRCKMKEMIEEQNKNKDIMIELLVKELEVKYDEKTTNIEIKYKEQIDELKNTIICLETKINKSNKKIITNSNNTNTNTNSNNTNNIIIQFGQENTTELLNPNEIAKIINRGYCAIQESVKQTHFNKRLPQLHNIYVSDKKFKHGLKYSDGKFELQDLNTLVNDLIDNHRNNIDEYLEINNIPYKKNMLEKVKDLLEILDDVDNPKRRVTREEIIKELKEMLYNGKDFVNKASIEV